MKMPNKKYDHFILFVDDEEKSRKYFSKIFQKQFNVITIDNADDAWNIIKTQHHKIAIVISDQKMPNSTGVDLLQKVKNKYPQIVRILTTAYADLQDNINAINKGNVFAYITKPWELQELQSKIYAAIGQYESYVKSINLGASIAHEMRNSLNSVNFMLSQIKEVVPEMILNDVLNQEQNNIKKVDYFTDTAINCIKKANSIIDIILTNLKQQKINEDNFYPLWANELIKQTIAEYGYSKKEEKDAISVNLDKNFMFIGDEALFTYILFNLLKNALYYLDSYPNSKITISSKIGEDKNYIFVKDTGPGIAEDNLQSIFDFFVTSGKDVGTGLGLPFCRRAMESFGGSIKCESKLNEYSNFILTFPKIKKEHTSLKNKFRTNTKILLVDDKELNLKLTNKIINNHLDCPAIRMAKDGQEAIDLAKQGNYDIILMDIEMPKIDGINATKEIRKFDKTTPIIAHTSLVKERLEGILNVMNDCILKSIPENLLIRIICKWALIDYIPEVKNKSLIKEKSILFADDSLSNSICLEKLLKNAGYIVKSVQNGKELLDEYINSFKKGVKYDLIISDINMPQLMGDESAKQIRKFEKKNNIKSAIPILAYSGDSNKDRIRKFFECGMTDYFVKGNEIGYLKKLIDFWIVESQI